MASNNTTKMPSNNTTMSMDSTACAFFRAANSTLWDLDLVWLVTSVVILVVGVACSRTKYKNTITLWNSGVVILNLTLWFKIIYLIGVDNCLSNGSDGFWLFNIFLCANLIVLTVWEMFKNLEAKYFLNQKPISEVSEYLEELKSEEPYIKVKVKVFDTYRQRHRGAGDTYYTEEELVRHEDEQEFTFETWEDQSEIPDVMALSEENPTQAFHVVKSIAPGDVYSQGVLDDFFSKLKENVENRGKNMFFNVDSNIAGYQREGWSRLSSCGCWCGKRWRINMFWFTGTYVIGVSDSSSKPCWLNSFIFFISCLLSISTLLRLIFRIVCKPKTITINKVFYCDPRVERKYSFDKMIKMVPGGGMIQMMPAPGQPQPGGMIQMMPAPGQPQPGGMIQMMPAPGQPPPGGMIQMMPAAAQPQPGGMVYNQQPGPSGGGMPYQQPGPSGRRIPYQQPGPTEGGMPYQQPGPSGGGMPYQQSGPSGGEFLYQQPAASGGGMPYQQPGPLVYQDQPAANIVTQKYSDLPLSTD